VKPESAQSFLAIKPVTFATAKLMPFKLLSGETPGIGRGNPEA